MKQSFLDTHKIKHYWIERNEMRKDTAFLISQFLFLNSAWQYSAAGIAKRISLPELEVLTELEDLQVLRAVLCNVSAQGITFWALTAEGEKTVESVCGHFWL